MIDFRPLEKADLEQLHAWLCEPEVARWYSSGAPTRAALRAKYLPRIEGASPTRAFVARVDGRDAGLAQTYAVAEYPRFARALGAASGWAGLDYFIGEPELRGRRLAHRLVSAFVHGIIGADMRFDVCVSLVAPTNVKSARALERAGFTRLRHVELEPGQTDALMARELAVGAARAPEPPGAAGGL